MNQPSNNQSPNIKNVKKKIKKNEHTLKPTQDKSAEDSKLLDWM